MNFTLNREKKKKSIIFKKFRFNSLFFKDNHFPGHMEEKITQIVPAKMFTHLRRGDSFKSLPFSPKHKDILPELRRFSSPKVELAYFASDIVRLEQENTMGDF